MLQICFCTSPILRIESIFETILGFLGITVMAVTLCYHCDFSQVGNRIFYYSEPTSYENSLWIGFHKIIDPLDQVILMSDIFTPIGMVIKKSGYTRVFSRVLTFPTVILIDYSKRGGGEYIPFYCLGKMIILTWYQSTSVWLLYNMYQEDSMF